MPIYQLDDRLLFPNPEGAEEGIVAIGGDLSPQRLLLAYRSGLFPWFDEDDPIIWWCPDPRYLLFPAKFHVSRSFKRFLNKKKYRITFDEHFESVIENCSSIGRKDQDGTWITPEMKTAYMELHQLGFAHSVEVWHQDELVGGMYGVSIGKAFFGESMFSKLPNASKTALYYLSNLLSKKGLSFIDAQIHTPHMVSLGAEPIARSKFLYLLDHALQFQTWKGKWSIQNELKQD